MNRLAGNMLAPALMVVMIAMVAGLSGCRGDRTDKPPRQFLPDMDDGPKWSPQSASPFFVDGASADDPELGRTMRPQPAGAVAFGALPVAAAEGQFDPEFQGRLARERDGYLRADDTMYYGVSADGSPVDRIPLEVTRRLLERGEERFNIFCAACHGYQGDGTGMVGRRWSIPIPNFHDPKYSDQAQRTGKDGYLFHVSRYGLKNPDGSIRMPSYGHALDAQDAWAVVAYIRALQAAGVGQEPVLMGEEGPQ